jgi:hypothetical protein
MKKLKDLNNGIDGIEFLRDLVKEYNCRYEDLNCYKTPIQLINEYLKYINGETDLEGNGYDEPIPR